MRSTSRILRLTGAPDQALERRSGWCLGRGEGLGYYGYAELCGAAARWLIWGFRGQVSSKVGPWLGGLCGVNVINVPRLR